MNDKSNKTVLLTGGSTGIGQSIAQTLLADGYHVINLSRRKADDNRIESIEVDLSDLEATREVATDVTNRYQVTNLVHNAGVIRENLLPDVSVEDLDFVSKLHLGAAIVLTQACLPAMKKASFGRIVLMSTRAIVGLAKRTVYSATKAGMIGMGRTWALELAGEGITVNMVAPGPIGDTEMFHDLIPKDSPVIQQVAKNVPVGRLGTPADIAHATRFFLQPACGFVTGQTLFVCGGTSLGSISFQ